MYLPTSNGPGHGPHWSTVQPGFTSGLCADIFLRSLFKPHEANLNKFPRIFYWSCWQSSLSFVCLKRQKPMKDNPKTWMQGSPNFYVSFIFYGLGGGTLGGFIWCFHWRFLMQICAPSIDRLHLYGLQFRFSLGFGKEDLREATVFLRGGFRVLGSFKILGMFRVFGVFRFFF